jgi:late competence protein required for DNA uptake (superfamily II DNA/RNA helicase)
MCFTADSLLSIIGRCGIRGSVLFAGVFVFHYGLKYSVIT